ncbi:MerR family transcriptional regulator [Antrihabitans cavernicola]|uniref:MerR family transcriptional regulator n=1 Tax=Antrihabitans cavernicola TaxID=2495913 RepID=A0A5A7S8U6_9NOCA|nr:MerR family transcriptional regulator [Spelaeibacter cavernicola]KAA0022346.1 MerR family transcriptional regulator [Spelaeibacter cavernicola]
MRVSELVAETGIPLATVKYYLREGLLMPGAATSATRSEYDDRHVHRLALVKALSGLGLPIPKIKVILELIDAPSSSLFDSLGEAIGALPPYVSSDGDFPRAEAVLADLGQVYDPSYVGVAQLESALRAAEEVGIPMTDDRLRAYGKHIMGLAEADVAAMPKATADAIEYAVLGTAIYEPVIAAMRRLAHQDIAAKKLHGERQGPDVR